MIQYPDNPILVVDDEPLIAKSVVTALRANQITNALSVCDSREVMPLLKSSPAEMVLLDLSMPHLDGLKLLGLIVRDFPEVPVVMVTADDDVSTVVECMRQGAFDYIAKPVEIARLLATVKRVVEVRDLRRENQLLRTSDGEASIEHPEAFAEIITGNRKMLSCFQYLEAVSRTSHPLLITGETGVGKELAARAAHHLSRREGEFVAVNVAGVDDTLFSDTLFGHRRGAFTGATSDRRGMLESAAGGTLFLDEIGDLSPASQVKLLRLIQEREYQPLGADRALKTDARIVVATHRDLAELQESKAFRRDLYYRLRAHHVNLPPLRERMDDLPLLVNHFLEQAAEELGKTAPTLPEEIYCLLGAYPFPGNVRELQSLVFDAVSKHKSGKMSLEVFRQALGQEQSLPLPEASLTFGARLPTLKECRDLLIDEALRRACGNQSVAANLLGITRQSLNQQLHRNEGK
jgi:DNA-binding NtrC family response regulator